jgi:DNA (cytosine-5)-methyltransferase 1
MMGLPDGWVTCTPNLTRSAMLKALGNGVVRLQAAAALVLLHRRATAQGEQTLPERQVAA